MTKNVWQDRVVAGMAMPRPETPDTRRGFTLIELLVVISVISLLVSILIPSIMKAKDLAKSVVCAANAKGMGTALFMHADECNEMYPCASNVGIWGEVTSNGIYSWMEQLFPYVEEKKLYVCPEKPNGSEYSYFLGSRAFILADVPNHNFGPVNRSRIKYSSAYVLSGCTGLSFGDLTKGVDDCDKDNYTQDCIGTKYTVHHGVQTVLFSDSHVQSYPGYVEGEMTFRYDEMGPRFIEGDPVK